MRQVTEAQTLSERGHPLPFGGILPVGAEIEAASGGNLLEPLELHAVANTARGLDALRKHLKEFAEDAPELFERAAVMADFTAVHQEIFRCIDDDGQIVDAASPALSRLRQQLGALRGQLESTAQKLLEDNDLSRHLQDRFYTQRDDRFVLPIKAGSQPAVKGIVHGTSQSGGTVFVEPEALVLLNNRLKMVEGEVAEEVRRILRELTDRVARHGRALADAIEIATVLDTTQAAAQLARDLDAAMPTIGAPLALKAGRHPMLVLSKRGCVPNDVRLEAGQILVVSGPNAGGKTVVLKTAGLAALMVRAGMFVCADSGSSVPWYRNVETDIGDAQSLDMDLSTFSGHVHNLNRMLADADGDTLILIDEIAAATEPEQGAALAQAILEQFADRGVQVIVTTHYERLKVLAAQHERMVNSSVGFNLDTLEPTFHLHMGIPGPSSALDVAKKLGMRMEILERARAILGSSRVEVEDLMREVSNQRQEIERERSALAAETLALRQAKENARAAEQTFKQKAKTVHTGAHHEAVSALRDARRELDKLKGTVQRRRPEKEIKELSKKVQDLASAVSAHAPEPEPAPGTPATEKTLTPGTPVYVLSLATRGEVVGAPSRGRIEVRVGALRTTQEIKNLHVLSRNQEKKAFGGAPKKAPAAAAVGLVKGDTEGRATVRTADATLDIRGQRVDEGIAALDKFLDQSFLAARDVIFVIHGHGTGALRDAIRDHLRSRPEISQFRPGEPGEGGDGVTVLFLDS